MTPAAELLQYILPLLAVSIAVVLLCFYHYSKKRRGSYDVTVPPLCPAPPQDGAEMVVFHSSVPPGYSAIAPPPPYSLFDPGLTSAWPGAAPPPYQMFPLSVPLAPHLWISDSPSTPHS